MLALVIAASGGIVVGLAVASLYGWFSRSNFKARLFEETQDVTAFSPYRSGRK